MPSRPSHAEATPRLTVVVPVYNGAWTLARLCDELQIDFEVSLFNRSFVAKDDDTEASYNSRRADATDYAHGG